MYELLENINSPEDLRKLEIEGLRLLCSEIRSYMVDCCSRNPGHLASSLGAVELTVGVHYVFDTPSDTLIFDVGHQAYAHKIITGRREAFLRNRTRDGISGFPNRSESRYDAFGTGHSSTSISAALGFAEAARMQGRKDKVIAIIGDGALTGGLAFEGLNNAGASKANLLVILNDNNQSIDGNIGALHNHLLKITTSRPFNQLKDKVWDWIGERKVRNFLQRWIRSFKSWLVKRSGGDLFEALGSRYFGPIDGNDIEQVVATLRKIKDMQGPRVLHCITVKGKGYAPAEADPVTWHAPGRFDPATGERKPSLHPNDRYQDVFGEVLCELSDLDDKVVGVTPAMARGCGMNMLAEHRPDRFFDVGIEEEHAVTFSAGLAAAGMKPVCNIYSSFSQRAYDQIIHDVALQSLPVTICLDRAGLVGEDGATHNGPFDIAAFRCIPGTVICSPRNELELKNLMYSATRAGHGPYIIRYPRGMGEGTQWRDAAFREYECGKAEELLHGSRVAVIGCGPCVNRAMEVAGEFAGKVGVYNFRFIKPLDTAMLEAISRGYDSIVTIEDASIKGGLYGAVCEWMAAEGRRNRIKGLGIPDRFIGQAGQKEQILECGLDCDGIRRAIAEIL